MILKEHFQGKQAGICLQSWWRYATGKQNTFAFWWKYKPEKGQGKNWRLHGYMELKPLMFIPCMGRAEKLQKTPSTSIRRVCYSKWTLKKKKKVHKKIYTRVFYTK